MNSDAAIVGLQAMQLLRGEWSAFLLGSRYQTSVDAVVAALLFRVCGPTPLALMLSAFVGHLLLTWIVYALLARTLGRIYAALLSSALVLTTCAVHVYALHPPRQTALTLAFFAVWLLTADHRIRSCEARLAMGAFVSSFSVFADPYALVFQPAFAAVSLTVVLSGRRGLARRAAAYVTGTIAGLLPLVALWKGQYVRGAPNEVIPSMELVRPRWVLLKTICMPVVLGMHAPGDVGAPGAAAQALCWAGAGGLTIAVVVACASLFMPRVPGHVRRLAIFGLGTVLTTCAGFVLSRCAVDLFSYRYLAAISLVFPLLFAPAAHVLGRRAWAVALAAPLVLSCGLAGRRELVDAVARQAPSPEANERGLEQVLLNHGVTRAVANYWISYRLTFLYGERILVVPREAWLDRYEPYRAHVLGGEKLAYLIEKGAWVDRDASNDERVRAFGTPYERLEAGRYTIFLVARPVASGASAEAHSLN